MGVAVAPSSDYMSRRMEITRMDTCSSCGYEVLPDEDFCTNCGSGYNRATKTSFSNPAVEAVATQLDAAVQQPQAARVPPSGSPMPAPAPRAYSKPLTIGGLLYALGAGAAASCSASR